MLNLPLPVCPLVTPMVVGVAAYGKPESVEYVLFNDEFANRHVHYFI
jgi:hypothetical protein